MARGAWQQTARLASIMAVPEEGESFVPADFNPFTVGHKSQGKSNLAPYDAQYLQQLQDAM